MVSDKWRRRALPHLISFATGSLLGAAFLGLLPHALESAGPDRLHEVGLAVLAGMLLGLAVALVLVGCVMVLGLRSIRLAAVAAFRSSAGGNHDG